MSADQVERKLAAIFAADVEGYSGLMGIDEVGTLRTPLQNKADAHLAGDLPNIDRLAFVGERRVAGDDEEVGDPR
jgi:hypothetical protein